MRDEERAQDRGGPPWCTLHEASRALRVSRRTLQRMIADGLVVTFSLRPGGRPLVARAEIERLYARAGEAVLR